MAATDHEANSFLFGEAKDHLEAVVKNIEATSDRAGSVIRFNVLVVGLLVTAISILARGGGGFGYVPPPVGVLVAAGFLALVASTAFAILSYNKRGVAVGLDGEDLVDASRAGLSLPTLLREAIGSYGEGILRNEEIAIVAGRRFDHALRMLLIGIALLALASMGLMLVEVN